MMTVKTVCIEVALLFSLKDEKTSLFSEDQIKSVRKNSITPVFKWKSALKFFPMMTVKTVCIKVALLISHKDEKISLFSEDQLKSVRKNSITPVFKWKSALKTFSNDDCEKSCLYRGSTPYMSFQGWLWTNFTSTFQKRMKKVHPFGRPNKKVFENQH